MFITVDNYWKDTDTFPIFGFGLFDTGYENGIFIIIFGIGVNIGSQHGGTI